MPKSEQADLFTAATPALPPGLVYEQDFLQPDEERSLVAAVQALDLREMRYLQYTAKRRVASFGGSYDFSAQRLRDADPLPAAFEPLRARAAAWAGVAAEAFTQALIAEYRPGTPLGWHRDVPDFEDVVGISLLNPGVMRLRPYPPLQPKRADVVKLELAPRSIYLLRGPARWAWQHSISPTRELRYSITLRTARAAGR